MGRGKDKKPRKRPKKTEAEKQATCSKNLSNATAGTTSLAAFYSRGGEEAAVVEATELEPPVEQQDVAVQEETLRARLAGGEVDIVVFKEQVLDGPDNDEREIVANLDA